MKIFNISFAFYEKVVWGDQICYLGKDNDLELGNYKEAKLKKCEKVNNVKHEEVINEKHEEVKIRNYSKEQEVKEEYKSSSPPPISESNIKKHSKEPDLENQRKNSPSELKYEGYSIQIYKGTEIILWFFNYRGW